MRDMRKGRGFIRQLPPTSRLDSKKNDEIVELQTQIQEFKEELVDRYGYKYVKRYRKTRTDVRTIKTNNIFYYIAACFKWGIIKRWPSVGRDSP